VAERVFNGVDTPWRDKAQNPSGCTSLIGYRIALNIIENVDTPSVGVQLHETDPQYVRLYKRHIAHEDQRLDR